MYTNERALQDTQKIGKELDRFVELEREMTDRIFWKASSRSERTTRV